MSTPPGVLFPEPYMDAALARLRAELPGAIQRQNAFYSDFVLPTPDVETGYTWGVDTAFLPPMVEVGVPEETLQDFSIQQHDADSTVNVIVRGWLEITESINSREKLARANYRFGRALADVLLAPDAFGLHVPVVEVRASWRLNPDTRDVDVVRGSTLLIFTVEGVETRA